MKKFKNVSAFKFKMLGENNVEIQATAIMQWEPHKPCETWIKFASIKYKGIEVVEILDGNHFGTAEGYTGTDVFKFASTLSDHLIKFPEEEWEHKFDIEMVELSGQSNKRTIIIPVSPALTISVLYDVRKLAAATNKGKSVIMSRLSGFMINEVLIDREDIHFEEANQIVGDPCYDCDVYESSAFFNSKKPFVVIPNDDMMFHLCDDEVITKIRSLYESVIPACAS